MITTTAWVRRGVAAQFPTKYEIDETEMNRISKLARMQLEDAKDELSAAQGGEDAMEEDHMDEAVEGDSEQKRSKDSTEAKTAEFVFPSPRSKKKRKKERNCKTNSTDLEMTMF